MWTSKVTIIWAPQPGMSANRRCKHHRRELSGVWLGGLREHREFHHRGSGWSPSCQQFFIYTDKIWANFWPSMHKHTAAEMGKSGQILETKQKQDKWVSRENCDFFLGHVVKNQDCPGKSGWIVTVWTSLKHASQTPTKPHTQSLWYPDFDGILTFDIWILQKFDINISSPDAFTIVGLMTSLQIESWLPDYELIQQGRVYYQSCLPIILPLTRNVYGMSIQAEVCMMAEEKHSSRTLWCFTCE